MGCLYRLVDTTFFSEEKTLPFSPWIFSYPARNWFTGIHPRREGVGVENAVGSSAVGIYTAGRRNVSVSRFLLSVEGDDLLFTYNWRRRMRVKRWLLAGIALSF